MPAPVPQAEVVDGVGQLGATNSDPLIQVDLVQAPLPNVLNQQKLKKIMSKFNL